MSYLDEIASKIRAEAPPSTLPEADTIALFRLYAVLALVKGSGVDAKDVHDAWAAWMSERDPDDPDIRPFADLGEPTRLADEPFAAAIRMVADKIAAS